MSDREKVPGEGASNSPSIPVEPQPTPPKPVVQKAAESAPVVNANHLTAAAVLLEKGDELGACYHLGHFLQKNPEHNSARSMFAELLWKVGKRAEARLQFERAAAEAQDEAKPDYKHLIHLHGRLLEAAEADDNEYQFHLQRGIGLYLLAQVRAQLKDPEGDLPVEGLLCKAAGELTVANALKPSEARPCWYLYSVWRQLAQQSQAHKWLARTQEEAPFSHLTPREQRGLQMALLLQGTSSRPPPPTGLYE